jgi:hypothetical protein
MKFYKIIEKFAIIIFVVFLIITTYFLVKEKKEVILKIEETFKTKYRTPIVLTKEEDANQKKYSKIKTTAILFYESFKDWEVLKRNVINLGRLEFMTEIIIINSEDKKVLQKKEICQSNCDNIKILNLSSKLREYSKLIACTIAKNKYCYFQDIVWDNRSIKSQYETLLQYPNTIISVVPSPIYNENINFKYKDEEKNLHTGVTYLNFVKIKLT